VLDVREKEVGQYRDKEVGHAAIGLLVEDGPDAKVASRVPEDVFHLSQSRIEGPDLAACPVGMAGLDDVGAGEEIPLLPFHVLGPDEVGDPGSRRGLDFSALPGRRLCLLVPGDALRDRVCGDGDDGVVFGDGGEARKDLSDPEGDGIGADAGSFLDGASKRFEGGREAGLRDGVHGVLLGLALRGQDQNAGDRFRRRARLVLDFFGRHGLRRRLRDEDLVEPDPLVSPLGMGGEPLEGLAGLFEELRVLLLHGTAFHHAVVVASRFHEGNVLLRRDAPVHDQGGLFRSGEDGKAGESLETVESHGEGLGLRLVAGADPGGDGEAPLVFDQREADQRAVGALFL